MAKAKNEIIGLVCTVCKSRNYVTTRNKTNLETKSVGQVTKLILKKFCKTCKKNTPHKETIKLK